MHQVPDQDLGGGCRQGHIMGIFLVQGMVGEYAGNAQHPGDFQSLGTEQEGVMDMHDIGLHASQQGAQLGHHVPGYGIVIVPISEFYRRQYAPHMLRVGVSAAQKIQGDDPYQMSVILKICSLGVDGTDHAAAVWRVVVAHHRDTQLFRLAVIHRYSAAGTLCRSRCCFRAD